MNILDKEIVFQLNRNWQIINCKTVRDTFTDIFGGGYKNNPPSLPLDITLGEDGSLEYATPVSGDDWINLPVRPGDLYVTTGRGQIRVPTVIICQNYAEMPMITPRPSHGTIRERDGSICQYTGRKLSRHEGNLDHVIPKSHGGKDTFENLVWCDKKLNSHKGNRRNEEIGLRLIRKPKAPPSVPKSFLFNEPKHPTHLPFLTR